MEQPDWADAQLSDDLFTLCSRGEAQDLEYMANLPTNARELAREIAAFATSNPGFILLGVDDFGAIVGLSDMEKAAARDTLIRRIEGLCKGPVKPTITPVIKFAHRDGKTVAVILVPKGSEPVYYYELVPYLRHVTESRPAEPHEVVDLVRSWLSAQVGESAEESPVGQLLSQVAYCLIDVLMYGEEYSDREVNPHFEAWRSQFQYCASQLRELSLENAATENDLASDLTKLAELLDEITTFRMTLGSGPAIHELVQNAVNVAYDIKHKHIDAARLSQSALDNAREALTRYQRRLRALVQRWDSMSERNQEGEFQAEASRIGAAILRLSYYDLELLRPGLSEELRTVGRRLHLLETIDTGYSDGGRSLRTIFETTAECADALEQVGS